MAWRGGSQPGASQSDPYSSPSAGREGCLMGPVREGAGALRPVGALPAAETPQAAGFVEPGLLALGAEEATCPELAQDTRALHSGLKPLEKTFRVLSFPKRDECQYATSCPHRTDTYRSEMRTEHANTRPPVRTGRTHIDPKCEPVKYITQGRVAARSCSSMDWTRMRC